MNCYKLNIFKDSRETWTESALNPFININPIYVSLDNNKDNYTSIILNSIAQHIMNLDYLSDETSELDFRSINKKYGISEMQINIKNNIHSIVDFLTNNTLLIYQHSTGKYWCRYYIEFNKTSNKCNEYTIDEINSYIEKMFDCE